MVVFYYSLFHFVFCTISTFYTILLIKLTSNTSLLHVRLCHQCLSVASLCLFVFAGHSLCGPRYNVNDSSRDVISQLTLHYSFPSFNCNSSSIPSSRMFPEPGKGVIQMFHLIQSTE